MWSTAIRAKVRLVVFVVVLISHGYVIAQTQWEYAHFEIASFELNNTFSQQISFYDSTRNAIASTWNEFSEQTGADNAGYLVFFAQLGKEGFEMVSHNISHFTDENNVQRSVEVWYFKKPLP